jgi:hypothetical protein
VFSEVLAFLRSPEVLEFLRSPAVNVILGGGITICGQFLAQYLTSRRERSVRRVESQIKTLEQIQVSAHRLRYRAERYLESCRSGPVSGDVGKGVSTLNSRFTISSRLTSEIERIYYLSQRIPNKALHELVAKLRLETYSVHNDPEAPHFETVNLTRQVQSCIGAIYQNLIN